MTTNEILTRRLEALVIENATLKMKVAELELQLKAENKLNIYKPLDKNILKLN